MGFSQFASQSKIRKNLIIASLAILGYLFGATDIGISKVFYGIICALIFTLMISWIRLWEEPKSNSFPPLMSALLLLALPLFLLRLFFDGIILSTLIALALAVAYYTSFINFKSRALLSTLTFFAMTLFIFIAGYGAACQVDPNAFIFGIYFALIFAAGQLVGEIVDFSFDQTLDVGSNARTFGLERVSSFSFMLFSIATAYLLILLVSHMIDIISAAPFLAAYAVLAIIFIKMKTVADPQNAIVFQLGYRVLFGLASFAFFIEKLL